MTFTRLFMALALLGGSLGANVAQAVVVDFTGGTARLWDGTDVATNNSSIYSDSVVYYDEGGFRFTFVGAYGTVGNYYAIGSRPAGTGAINNDVVHAHWGFGLTAMTITALDGSAFDLNYIDLTSNTVVGGGQADGTEDSYITAGTHSMKLPSSDWGFDYDYFAAVGDGVSRLYLDSNFDNVTSVTFTSTNAYCFGMDNFYINEPAPPIPEPLTAVLMGIGLAGIGFARRRMA